jgi:hypothetical protein
VSDVAPNSQVKVFAQLLLQNAVDVLPKLDAHNKTQVFIEVFHLISEAVHPIASRANSLLQNVKAGQQNEIASRKYLVCSLPLHDPQFQYNFVTTFLLIFDNINK